MPYELTEVDLVGDFVTLEAEEALQGYDHHFVGLNIVDRHEPRIVEQCVKVALGEM